MSASTMTSAARVLVLDVEVSPRATLAHPPHGGEMGRGERLVSRPRSVRREAVVSLDTSRAPATLFDVGIGPRPVRHCSKIFSIYFPSRRFLLYIEGEISRGSPERRCHRNRRSGAGTAMFPWIPQTYLKALLGALGALCSC